MIFTDEQRREINELLSSNLEQPVTVVFFTQDEPSIELPVKVEVTPCEYCKETEEMLRELTGLSDKLNIEVYDFIKDKDKVGQYSIDGVPALALIGDRDYGIRYYGIPSGYEFSALLDGLINVSKRKTKLSEDTKRKLAEIQQPVRMRVFVTPT
ncbi:MAG: thioredoxin family protein [Firmicutes bacterium]|nr:thioredoxin family protein [Bacillota bacterium]